ncbi:MAG: potassium transporter TrkA [Alphaproteobacteria bacterium]|nr:potassium transporter TrkA [Alphaproteobacteria bacterium]
MNAHPVDFGFVQEILIVLGAVSIVIPIFHRLKLSPVLGFLLIGMILGPTLLGALIRTIPGLDWVVITDRERIGVVAEFGVIFLMFMIGLELSFERLSTMRRLVFGLGPLQMLLCAAAIAAAAGFLGQPRLDAIVIGLALAMSSTAVILQVLADERRMNSSVGRTSFSILLFQDIAVVPVLFAVSVMVSAEAGEASPSLLGFVFSLGQATIAVGLVIIIGRIALRPLFRSVARTNSQELIMAASLLVLFSAAAATASAGLSMAMGGLLAGLLLAETEYRRQIEVLIEPFKGLLLGVFLISMGMTIDLRAVVDAPFLVVALCAALIAVKAVLTWAAARLLRVPQRTAVQSALLIAPAGEFSLIVLSAAAALGVFSRQAVEIALIVAAVTMALIPFMSRLGKVLDKRLEPKREIEPAFLVPEDLGDAPRVIIAGYGRVGRVVAEMLQRHGKDFIAVDLDPDVVAQARKEGASVFYGDITRPDFLRRCGIETALALVVTMDSTISTELVVDTARRERSDLCIVARARDERHAARLYARGATDAVPETVEASLLLSESLLIDIGVPAGPVIASIHDRRAAFRAEIQQLAPKAEVRPPRRKRLLEFLKRGDAN